MAKVIASKKAWVFYSLNNVLAYIIEALLIAKEIAPEKSEPFITLILK